MGRFVALRGGDREQEGDRGDSQDGRGRRGDVD